MRPSTVRAALVLTSFFATAGVATADPFTVDLVAGTTGVGPQVRVPLSGGTTLRVGAGALTFGRNSTFSNNVIDARVNLALNETVNIRTGVVSIERMNAHGLGIVGGVFLNGNGVHAVSVPTDSTVTIGGTTYTQAGAGVIYTDVSWNRIAPYLGVRLAPTSLHGAFLEVGGYYQGAANVTFSATGAIAANQSKFQPYYDSETAQLRRELAPVQVYPVVTVGIPLLRR